MSDERGVFYRNCSNETMNSSLIAKTQKKVLLVFVRCDKGSMMLEAYLSCAMAMGMWLSSPTSLAVGKTATTLSRHPTSK